MTDHKAENRTPTVTAKFITPRSGGYSATVPQGPVRRLNPPTSGSATSRGDNNVKRSA